jgi:hypothetical protein
MPGQETTGNLFADRSGACSPQPVFALAEDGTRITINISQRAVTCRSPRRASRLATFYFSNLLAAPGIPA